MPSEYDMIPALELVGIRVERLFGPFQSVKHYPSTGMTRGDIEIIREHGPCTHIRYDAHGILSVGVGKDKPLFRTPPPQVHYDSNETKTVTFAKTVTVQDDAEIQDLDELEQEMRDLEEIRQELEEELAADQEEAAAEQMDWLECEEEGEYRPPFADMMTKGGRANWLDCEEEDPSFANSTKGGWATTATSTKGGWTNKTNVLFAGAA